MPWTDQMVSAAFDVWVSKHPCKLADQIESEMLWLESHLQTAEEGTRGPVAARRWLSAQVFELEQDRAALNKLVGHVENLERREAAIAAQERKLVGFINPTHPLFWDRDRAEITLAAIRGKTAECP